MSNNDSDFMRGLRTGGTLFENPVPRSLDEWNGQQMAKGFQNPGPGGGAGAAGGGLAWLIIIVAAAVVIVPAAIAALPGALALMAVTGLFARGGTQSYFEAYKTSFWALLAYFVLSFGCNWVFGQMLHNLPPGAFMQNLALGGVVAMSAFQGLDAEAFGPLPEAPLWAVAGGALMLQGLPLLAVAFIIRLREGHPYRGMAGFLKALLAALVLAVIGAVVAWLGLHVLYPHADPLDQIGGVRPSALIVPALMAVAAVAIAGATLLAPLLMLVSGRPKSARPSFLPSWVVAALALGVAAATALIAFYLFRVADDGFMLLVTQVLTLQGDPGISWSAALPGLLMLTLPGSVTAALIVAMNLNAYRGGTGVLRALALVTPFGLAASGASVIALMAIAF